jgi:hypothetical protein
MVFDWTNVPWLGVLVATVAAIVIGFVWYMPQVLGRRWSAAAGVNLPGGMPAPTTLIGGVVVALITAYVLALFIGASGATDIVGGAVVGAVAWLGFVATWSANTVLYENRSWEYFGINAGYALVAMIVMGAIIGYF